MKNMCSFERYSDLRGPSETTRPEEDEKICVTLPQNFTNEGFVAEEEDIPCNRRMSAIVPGMVLLSYK